MQIPLKFLESSFAQVALTRYFNVPAQYTVKYKSHKTPKLKWFSSRLAAVFAKYIETGC